jgi:hypothetical protein
MNKLKRRSISTIKTDNVSMRALFPLSPSMIGDDGVDNDLKYEPIQRVNNDHKVRFCSRAMKLAND